VRTVEDCIEQSLADVTVITNLMESRLLAGNAGLYRRMQEVTGPDRIWNSREFFQAKHSEQLQRHHKYHDTAYKLEPNVKESPGGLRDIQVIAWVANRHFGTGPLEELVEHGFLTEEESSTLVEGRDFLWEVRFALHTLTGRGEDRLLFDYQRTLASQFGYRDDDNRLAVEAFMKRYYQAIMELRTTASRFATVLSKSATAACSATSPMRCWRSSCCSSSIRRSRAYGPIPSAPSVATGT
jgi:[protein-PII] uridylyltransferase